MSGQQNIKNVQEKVMNYEVYVYSTCMYEVKGVLINTTVMYVHNTCVHVSFMPTLSKNVMSVPNNVTR